MVLDSTVMNVSISTVVKDLNTTVAAMQMAITFFTLTMAALMLTGGRLGDLWGRKKAFVIGLIIYGIGSLITAVSPNIQILMIGWSLVEGLGAVLVIPAIAALVASKYEGKDRLSAYAIIGAVAGAAAAAGPLIGGFVTTYLSWRYVFGLETLIVLVILMFYKSIPSSEKSNNVKLDIPSVLLSAGGMLMLIFGILQGKVWGWIKPMTIPEIAGRPIAPFGISIVTYLIFAGIMLLIWFLSRQKSLIDNGKQPLLDVTVLKIPKLRGGLSVLLSQYLIVGATFFVLPIYLQMVIGLDALSTGLRILPLSIALIIFSGIGSRLVSRFTPKNIVRFGQIALIGGVAMVLFTINPQLNSKPLMIGMFLLGSGLGLLASQLGNINMNAVDKRHSSEVGGMQGTAQNLGSSLGTAIIGTILIMTLSSGFAQKVTSNPNIPSNVQAAVAEQAKKGIPVLSGAQVDEELAKQGYTESQASVIVNDYTTSQLEGLKQALAFLLLIAIASVFLSKNLPNNKITKITDLQN